MLNLAIGLISLTAGVFIMALGIADVGELLQDWRGRADVRPAAMGAAIGAVGFCTTVAAFAVPGR